MIQTTCGILAGLALGITIGLGVAWVFQVEHDRQMAELAADLNAYRTMVEWEKLKEPEETKP